MKKEKITDFQAKQIERRREQTQRTNKHLQRINSFGVENCAAQLSLHHHWDSAFGTHVRAIIIIVSTSLLFTWYSLLFTPHAVGRVSNVCFFVRFFFHFNLNTDTCMHATTITIVGVVELSTERDNTKIANAPIVGRKVAR